MLLLLFPFSPAITVARELFNKLDDEHGEEEKEEGKPIVCKKHLGLSLRAINENIDENPEVCISCRYCV